MQASKIRTCNRIVRRRLRAAKHGLCIRVIDRRIITDCEAMSIQISRINRHTLGRDQL